MVCDADKSSSYESDNDSSSDSEDFSDKKFSSKMVDKWIQCDMCTEWFHLISLPQNVDPEDDFVCF